jgi:tRNA threonylcarbamoyladenosine biosynthesis protein TsaB
VLVLVVESATEAAGVALADEDGVLGSVTVARGRRHTETIAPSIEAICGRLGVGLTDLDMVGVDVGPGLFTGLRVGVGTVKALAFALSVPVVTAGSLEVLAHGLVSSGGVEGRLVVPVIDARRAEVFSSRFRVSGGALLEVGSDAVGDPEALAADLAGLDEPVVLVGNGALRYDSLFSAVPGATLAGPAYSSPPVMALAELCVARGLAGRGHDGAGVMPRYLRKADARINWEQRIPARPGRAGG